MNAINNRIVAFFQNFHLTGLHFNVLFAIYFFTLAPYVKSEVLNGGQNYILGVIGLIFYVLEAIFIRIKTVYVMNRAEGYYQNVVRKESPERKQRRPGVFVWYNILCRFLFRIGIIILCLHFFGIAKTGNEPGEQSTLATICFIMVVMYELFEFGYYSHLSSSFVDDNKKEWTSSKYSEFIAKKMDKLQKRKYWFLRNESVADLVLFIYGCLVFTALWDTIGTEIIAGIENGYQSGDSLMWTIFSILMQYGTLCLFALLPIRIAYWIEETVMAYGKTNRWRLVGSYLLNCIALMFPAIIKLVELYGN